MRIAYVCADPGVPVFGSKGSSVHVQEVIRALIALGADVEIFATRLDGDPPEGLEHVKLHWLSALPKGDLAVRERASLGANQGLAAALRVAGSFDLVYERYSLWSYAGMEFALATSIPGILEVNAPLIEEQAKHRGLLDRTTAEHVADRVFKAASAAVVVSREVAKYLQQFPGIAGAVHIVPNGVNVERFTPQLSLTGTRIPGEFTVGFLGTLKPWHGLPVLSAAFARFHQQHSDARLLVAGDGPERDSFEADLAYAGVLGAVRFEGAVLPEKVPGLLAAMDVAVAPYPAEQNFYFSPLKVYEYMAAALPIVTSAIGQLEELIQDGLTGLLCPPGDVDALTAALNRLYANPDLRRTLGEAARQTVVAEHTWMHVGKRILEVAALENRDISECVAGAV